VTLNVILSGERASTLICPHKEIAVTAMAVSKRQIMFVTLVPSAIEK
jgi:hypothetical protein